MIFFPKIIKFHIPENTMEKLFIKELGVRGKKVLMRVDFNVPLDPEQKILDATRILAALPSIEYILKQGGSVILMSHLGRPQGEKRDEFSLRPIAKLLEKLLKRPILMAPDSIGEKVEALATALMPGDVLLLENLRFHLAETEPGDGAFAKELAELGDCYVNDAFGTAHRKHTSTFTLPALFPGKAAAGFLMEKELRFLEPLLISPRRPFMALIGGAKISTKLGVIQSLVERVDALLIGGAMAFTFLAAKAIPTGSSLVEEEMISLAQAILERCEERKIPLVLPVDFIVAKEMSNDAPFEEVDEIPPGWMGLDLGTKSIKLFSERISQAATLLWNGPVGVYEFAPFSKGTRELAKCVANSSATTIVGGGDSLAAISSLSLESSISHLSTGGGATLEFIEHGSLPGLEALSSRSDLNK